MALHPQSRALLEELGEPAGPPASLDEVVATRAAARELALAGPRVGLDHVADVDADSVPCRLYRPRLGAPAALYVHGGGWVFHDLETHDAFCRHLAHVTGWALLSVDYRLAPEHPHPAGLDDLERAARWLREEGRTLRVDTGWVPGIGDSAGANLLAGLTVREPRLLDALALLYPPTDRRAELPADLENAALVRATMEWMWQVYAPGDAGELAEVSVLRAPNLAGFPPTHVVTCEHDILRDQGEQLAVALADAGVEVTGHRALGMVHSFWRQPERFDAARELVVSVGAWLDSLRARARHQ
ncbi:alpha/beta hydrolase [Aeromicrobium sp. CTD01-1L150]|uniref:alpha/beta hydrolase n=1 Tax=Aeromicrobium sp. CTD01-1L150 TaxID=3341830 RepID=UPI0035C041B1